MADWSRIVNTTIHEYVRSEEENILRNRKVLALLKSRGRITFGHGGDLMDWKVKYKRAPMQGFADTDTLTFSRKDRWKTAQLDYRGYASTDSMTKLEKLKNRSTEAIVKVYSQIATNLMDDMDDQFADELYIDGNGTGNGKRIHGIESFFGHGGAAAGGYIATPSDTYAGLNTALQAYGGSWSGTWPNGKGDAHYDFWSPLIVDYTDTAWGLSGTEAWYGDGTTATATCRLALSYGIIKGKKNKSKKGMLDVIILNDEMFRQLSSFLAANERMTVTRGDSKGGLYALGFTDTINLDGVDVTFEYGIPENVGYGLSIDNMELCSMQEQMFVPVGPDFDIASQSWRFSIDFFGNLKCNPRYFTKWLNVT